MITVSDQAYFWRVSTVKKEFRGSHYTGVRVDRTAGLNAVAKDTALDRDVTQRRLFKIRRFGIIYLSHI